MGGGGGRIQRCQKIGSLVGLCELFKSIDYGRGLTFKKVTFRRPRGPSRKKSYGPGIVLPKLIIQLTLDTFYLELCKSTSFEKPDPLSPYIWEQLTMRADTPC